MTKTCVTADHWLLTCRHPMAQTDVLISAGNMSAKRFQTEARWGQGHEIS